MRPKKGFYKDMKECFPDVSIEDARMIANGERYNCFWGKEENQQKYPSTYAWIKGCYFRPKKHEVFMSMFNELIGGYGVEYVGGEELDPPLLSYVNMGDTYSTTILYKDGLFFVGCWGDVVEKYCL